MPSPFDPVQFSLQLPDAAAKAATLARDLALLEGDDTTGDEAIADVKSRLATAREEAESTALVFRHHPLAPIPLAREWTKILQRSGGDESGLLDTLLFTFSEDERSMFSFSSGGLEGILVWMRAAAIYLGKDDLASFCLEYCKVGNVERRIVDAQTGAEMWVAVQDEKTINAIPHPMVLVTSAIHVWIGIINPFLRHFPILLAQGVAQISSSVGSPSAGHAPTATT